MYILCRILILIILMKAHVFVGKKPQLSVHKNYMAIYESVDDVCYDLKHEPNIVFKLILTLTNKYTNVFTESCPFEKV